MDTGRNRFYTNYYSNQASRTTANDLKEQAVIDARFFERELLPFIPSDKGSSILELGAGYGSMQLFLANQGYTNARGIDISSEQVARAKELNAEVTEADLDEALQADVKYDCIIGFDILEHFNRNEALDMLERIKERLNPGGMIVFRCPNADAPLAGNYTRGDITHDLFLNRSSATQLLLAAGFNDPEIHKSYIWTPGLVKNAIRGFLWSIWKIHFKLLLFSSGRPSTIITPNIILTAKA